MHKKLLNECRIDLTIEPKGPILIKAADQGADPSRPDMEFVRTNHAELGETVYLPGSSLKGVFRSYCEKICRTVGVRCCNPLDTSGNGSCSKRLEKENDSPVIYKKSCYPCKLFGSTVFRSRFDISDAYPVSDVKVETRTNVAIDRILGSVEAGPFDMEAVTAGRFKASIHIKNFELWQLGLVGLALRDLQAGYVKIGFAKSRGLGDVNSEVTNLEMTYFGYALKDNEIVSLNGISDTTFSSPDGKLALYGMGKLVTDEEQESYGFDSHDEIILDSQVQPKSELLRLTYVFDAVAPVFQAAVERFREVLHDGN